MKYRYVLSEDTSVSKTDMSVLKTDMSVFAQFFIFLSRNLLMVAYIHRSIVSHILIVRNLYFFAQKCPRTVGDNCLMHNGKMKKNSDTRCPFQHCPYHKCPFQHCFSIVRITSVRFSIVSALSVSQVSVSKLSVSASEGLLKWPQHRSFAIYRLSKRRNG